jgi:ATP-dependent exoDNAse (exonuclease V) alpha subunit
MAIFHCQIKPVSRGKGKSCVGAAAYRACEKLIDDRTGIRHDYTSKRGLVDAYILTPDKTPISRQALWDKAEAAEVRKDARTAREYEVALPHELPEHIAIECANRFASGLVRRYGCAADIAIHSHGAGDKRNFHAHILTTTRKYEAGQLTEKTHAELSDKKLRSIGIATGDEQVTKLRAAWAAIVNDACRGYGIPGVSPLSLKAQGIDREPPVHLGPEASAMERRGIRTRLGNENRRSHGEPLQESIELESVKEEIAMREEVHAEIEAAKTDLPRLASLARAEQQAIERAERAKQEAELAAKREQERQERQQEEREERQQQHSHRRGGLSL